MILSKEKIDELQEASKPLMKFLSENFHPHVNCIVDSTTCTISEESATVTTTEFIKD